jgi:hypothetical protein
VQINYPVREKCDWDDIVTRISLAPVGSSTKLYWLLRVLRDMDALRASIGREQAPRLSTALKAMETGSNLFHRAVGKKTDEAERRGEPISGHLPQMVQSLLDVIGYVP